MKVKCTRLINTYGEEVGYSPWLTLGKIYHVMAVAIDPEGKRKYRIITHESPDEWPDMGYQLADCFEIVSDVVPSNWRVKIYKILAIEISPAAWQESGFWEAFYDHDPITYPIFVRERDLILREDP